MTRMTRIYTDKAEEFGPGPGDPAGVPPLEKIRVNPRHPW
jgi:hypothetical protein